MFVQDSSSKKPLICGLEREGRLLKGGYSTNTNWRRQWYFDMDIQYFNTSGG
jgi:hypothetical protein